MLHLGQNSEDVTCRKRSSSVKKALRIKLCLLLCIPVPGYHQQCASLFAGDLHLVLFERVRVCRVVYLSYARGAAPLLRAFAHREKFSREKQAKSDRRETIDDVSQRDRARCTPVRSSSSRRGRVRESCSADVAVQGAALCGERPSN